MSASRSMASIGPVPTGLHVVPQPLSSAGDPQQFAVARFAPAPWHSQGLERSVKCAQMSVAFRLRQGAIDIPEQRLERHRLVRLSG